MSRVAANPMPMPTRSGAGMPTVAGSMVPQALYKELQLMAQDYNLPMPRLQSDGSVRGVMRNGQGFQSNARSASISANGGRASVNAFAGGNFDPMARSQVGGRMQPMGLLDDLIGGGFGGGLGGIGRGGFGLDGLLGGLGGGGGYFEDRVAMLMIETVEDMQRKIEQRLQKLQSDAQSAEAQTSAGGKDTGSESRNIEFEKIKFDMQKLSQIQQAMSNVLNTMDELAKSAIRNIKG